MKIIQKYCKDCKTTHIQKIYDNKSESIADTFTEEFFPKIWEKMEKRSKEMQLKDLCKEIFLIAVYNYHKHGRHIKSEKIRIEADKGN